MKFKKGDRVMCVNNPNAKINCHGSGWKLGRVFTINSITDNNNTQILWAKHGSGIYNEYVVHTNWKNRFGGK